MMRRLEKQLMLRVVDSLWVRHLTALDALRDGIGLRAIAQQDPLVAYQKEAFEMFGQLREAIKNEVVRNIFHVNVVQPKEAPRPKNIQTIHPSAAAASRQANAETPGATDQPPTPVRVTKTPGRNDPCWCGSGKKYKSCHMKSDRMGGNGGSQTAQNGGGRASSSNKKSRVRTKK
jgi:preprotein translocase subunit SecA